ncbi:hypothetical protein BU17DRAFT_87080 [Hysterangium stoloniferum]|nr:hypothetical protein BU17DRAFT_87080 [Hysterangium stoloniferum]
MPPSRTSKSKPSSLPSLSRRGQNPSRPPSTLPTPMPGLAIAAAGPTTASPVPAPPSVSPPPIVLPPVLNTHPTSPHFPHRRLRPYSRGPTPTLVHPSPPPRAATSQIAPHPQPHPTTPHIAEHPDSLP